VTDGDDLLGRLKREANKGIDLLAQRLDLRADIAVTGLRRAGKSVFITSLIHNLTRAAQDGAVLPALRAALSDRLIAVEERPPSAASDGGIPVFPTRDYLAVMAGERPDWPEPTRLVSRTELIVRYRAEGLLAWAGLRTEGTLTLGIVDYPGEWLLDVPMLAQSYGQWSAATIERLRKAPRLEAAREFLALIDSFDPMAPPDDVKIAEAVRVYGELLVTLRDSHGLAYLQPGRQVMPDGGGERPALWFVPIDVGPGFVPVTGTLGARLGGRYDSYLRDIVRPFFESTFDATNRQVVLVDLIAALNAGPDAFQDAAEALDAIAEGLLRRREGPLGLLFPRRFDKVLFAATKADFVPESQRDRLGQLLRTLVTPEQNAARMAGAEARSMALAAARCTRDEEVTIEIGDVEVVVGVPVEGDRRVKVYAGTIPKEPPPRSFWNGRTVRYPVFRPPHFNARPGHGIPHINMDAALEFLIGDLLR
jgi:predicted YcjX-like family ATPase